MKAKLLGTGRALPGEDVAGTQLGNVELARLMNEVRERLAVEAPEQEVLPTDADFPERRLGVLSRRVLDASLTVRDLAIHAARSAVADAGVDIASIGAVYVNTTTPDGLAPTTASSIHAALGMEEDVFAVDQSLGCNGFIGGMYNAQGAVGRNEARPNVLVVGAECMTSVLDASDRTTMPIFGDGSGAAVFGPPESDDLPGVWMATQGVSARNITVHPDLSERPIYRVRSRNGQCVVEQGRVHRYVVGMEGREVFKDMVRLLPPRIEACCQRAGLELEDVDLFLFHQANARMIEAVTQRVIPNCAAERVPIHIETLGNTSSASVPILLDQVRKSGAFTPGKRALLCAFGTGYSMGMTILNG
ncbi:3-oxoacyl-[acyl-carrier-protein] synthase 3 [Planctomycetes bacterium Poly30]|uniref:3-oxoacyl-[acyl-carrier-protein] synthase 3 n=1 Tax=Saltatorellus ferox TaxID=2528018 RepID=A0A518F0J3_9BACT|nr:3-oxoacyl-[acyl-carrier-protein] synthase 3 [Planctomycetes bacterium Poly30]